jgi:hypothetical protein
VLSIAEVRPHPEEARSAVSKERFARARRSPDTPAYL